MSNVKLISMAAGLGIALAGGKIYSNKTGKTVGCPASVMHVLTNDKLDNKMATTGEMLKESIKDTAILGGVALGTAGTASLIVGNSNKASKSFANLIKKAGEKLSHISVNGTDLKSIIKDTKLYSKINNLPLPAKAGLAAGIAAFSFLAPSVALTSAFKQGYIEGKHELNPHIDLQSVAKECKKGCVA